MAIFYLVFSTPLISSIVFMSMHTDINIHIVTTQTRKMIIWNFPVKTIILSTKKNSIHMAR